MMFFNGSSFIYQIVLCGFQTINRTTQQPSTRRERDWSSPARRHVRRRCRRQIRHAFTQYAVVRSLHLPIADSPWRIVEMTRVDPQPERLISNEMMTSDEWKVTQCETGCGFATHPVFGEIFFGKTDIQGFANPERGRKVRFKIMFDSQIRVFINDPKKNGRVLR